ncbi:MAG: T9SS type A sorting domain-containing protein [Lewinellaceae bacterium]|nr:T9SS type A sorting domain-containing protein [Lewinellaceae bacterium]
MQGAIFTTDVTINKTGTGNAANLGDGMTYQGAFTFTNAGGNTRFGRDAYNTYLGNASFSSAGGDLYVGEGFTSTIDGNLSVNHTGSGQILIGTSGGGATVGGAFSVSTSGSRVLLNNLTEGTAGADISLSGLSNFDADNCSFKSNLSVSATTVGSITGSTFAGAANSFTANNITEVNTSVFGTPGDGGSTTFTKNTGTNNPWDGGNTFNHEVTFNRNSSSAWRLGVTTGNTFEGNVTINNNNSGSFYFSDTDSQFKGNLALNGNASSANGPVTFNGSSAQEITGVDGWTIPTLNLDNSNGLAINPSLIITSALNFTSGIVTMGGSSVLSFAGGSISGAGAGKFIDGAIQKRGQTSVTNFTYHVGDNGFYAPLSFTTSNAGGTPWVTVQYIHSAAPGTPASPLETVSQAEHWTLLAINTNIANTAVTLPYSSGSQSGLIGDRSDLRVARTSDNGVTWENLGGTAPGLPSGTITGSAMTYTDGTSYIITLASVNEIRSPLPVNLVYFDGRAEGDQVRLKWGTATELNNDYFQVERSTDGRTFQELGRVQGAGTTLEPQEYSFIDEKPLRGINYYRLRQVDFDGAVEYHKVISVEYKGKSSAIGVSAFPNPANEMLHTSWLGSSEQPTTLRVLDMTGRQVAQYQAPAGTANFEVPLDRLQAGLYLLEVRQGSAVEVVRFRKG